MGGWFPSGHGMVRAGWNGRIYMRRYRLLITPITVRVREWLKEGGVGMTVGGWVCIRGLLSDSS